MAKIGPFPCPPSDDVPCDVPALSFSDVCFAYPTVNDSDAATRALDHVDLEVPQGAFCLLVGPTGGGKTTLLRLAKPEIAPAGRQGGAVCVLGHEVGELTSVRSASEIGFVFQSPDNQVVCDTVWHEMAFGLENLGTPVDEMRRRVAETCYFFGIEPWFRRDVATLSGGQRQVLALASVMAMRPRLLLLDEPTSMLDPIAEKNFLHALFRLNHELGLTVVVATHRAAPMRDYATMALRMEGGRVESCGLGELAAEPSLGLPSVPAGTHDADGAVVRLSDVWFSYGRKDPWVLRGCSLEVGRGEVRALVGGNGCGKSTLLATMASALRPQRGRVGNSCASSQALLPQSPKAILACESVADELMEWSGRIGYGRAEVADVMGRLGLEGLDGRHPYDLSGGQQQLLALGKLLLTRPGLLLLDEPTKGLDPTWRRRVALLVRELADRGTTVIMATHDLGFARQTSDSVSMLFDGSVSCTQAPGEFFRDNLFYQA